MDGALRSRAVVVGHLTLTAPAIVVSLLSPFLALRALGPTVVPYYFLAGLAIAWQWYLVGLPGWKKWLANKGAPAEEVHDLAYRAGLVWPVDAAIGPFALHTAAAAICGTHLGPWLLNCWYAWLRPLAGMTSHHGTGNDYLQNFELVSILPALILGYLLSRRFERLATYAWILPTIILGYKLVTFAELPVSVLAPHSSTRFGYFFTIQRIMPTFTPGFGGVDVVRVALQMSVVAPFYAGLAYSAGAIAGKQNLLKRVFGHTPMQLKSENAPTEENLETGSGDQAQTVGHLSISPCNSACDPWRTSRSDLLRFFGPRNAQLSTPFLRSPLR